MKIIIIGCGRVGTTLAEQLSEDENDITIIDTSEEKISAITDRADVMGVRGNGASVPTLMSAGIERADLLIAATESDELNILSCLTGRKLGAGNTIARVRSPEYSDVLPLIKNDLGLSMSFNPDAACAEEMVRVLKFPSMIKVDQFVGGRAEMLEFAVPDSSPLVGVVLENLWKINPEILVCAVMKKDGRVLIPSGSYVIEESDRLEIAGKRSEVLQFFNTIGVKFDRIRNIVIVGGDRISYYLSRSLLDLGMHVKIIEKDRERCLRLAEALPGAAIVCGDGTDQQFLREEGVAKADAFASLTGIDEQNIMLSMYIRSISKAKLITKISNNPFATLLPDLDLGSVFYPYISASEQILRFIRAMKNSYESSEVEALFRIADEKAEALEFTVGSGCSLVNKRFRDLEFKKNVLVGLIGRNSEIIIPRGGDMFRPGDRTVVITTGQIDTLEDIVK
ncbi:MAG: Trk system potassium transporter TrkA [Firmicutes bacterium]|nr:Trk system potassium transporter TrkA [Bacillota bacterium]